MSARFEPVAIVGSACILPEAFAPEELWSIVASGRDVLTPVSPGRWSVPPERFVIDAAAAAAGRAGSVTSRGGFVRGFAERFDPEGFALEPGVVATLEPLTQWLLHAGREALRDAGRDRRPSAFRRGGVVVGNLAYPTEGLTDEAERVRAGCALLRPLNRFNAGLPALHLAQALGLEGGAFALDAACASSLYALRLACDHLNEGSADYVLAGAINRIDSIMLFGGFTALGALSASGRSRPFDRDADGLLPAEGAVLFVLKRLNDAIDDGDTIAGVIRAVGLSNDGGEAGLLVPHADGQEAAMRAAYAAAGIAPGDVSLIECHATGTARGDRVEIESTGAVYAGLHDVAIGALKGNLGHTVTASGGAGLLKVLQAIRHAQRPPTIGAETPLPALADSPFRLVRALETWPRGRGRIAAVSSFGFGGNNAHLIVEEWDGSARRAVAVDGIRGEPPRVAIVAIAARAADGRDLDDLRAHLLDARPRGGPHGAPATTIELALGALRTPPNELRKALPQQLFALAIAGEAAAQVRTLPERTSVLVGLQCDAEATRIRRRWNADHGGEPAESGVEPVTAASILGAMPNMPANRISAQLGLRGPSFSVFAEELSGLRALELAVRGLERGETDAAIVAAVDLCVEPVHTAALRALLLDPERPGDAGVALVLKREADARSEGDTIVALVDAPAAGAGDTEGAALARWTRKTFGATHAASTLLDVAVAALVLRDGVVPPHGGVPPMPRLGAAPATSRLPAESIFGPRYSVTLRPDAGAAPGGWRASETPVLRLYGGATREELRRALRDDAPLAGGYPAPPAWRVAVVAPRARLAERRAAAESALERLDFDAVGAAPDGVFFGHDAEPGELAFVFTGASAAYAGMGRELLLALPELGRETVARFPGIDEPAAWIYRAEQPRGDYARLAATTFLTQAHALLLRERFGIVPDAALGLSSGETNALFALGAWDDLAGMYRDIRGSGMYDRDLAGEYATVRDFWERSGIDGAGWATWHASAPLEAVRAAAADEPAVAATIVNSPSSVVFAGERSACERVARRLGGRAAPIDVELACHTPAIAAYAGRWHALHSRPTHQPAGIRFYSNAHNAPYQLSRESVAEALTRQAVGPIDFTQTIERAWDDGVRVFVELGPRDHCTRAIGEILGARAHLAVAMDRVGCCSYTTALAAAARLYTRGVPLALQRVAALEHRSGSAASGGPLLSLPAHWPPLGPSAGPRRAPKLALPPPRHWTERAALVANGEPGLRLSRHGLETHAGGRISEVFGPFYARQDGFARQVRMPQPPLLLADRVTGLAGAGDRGRVWTETDVRADSWYVREGRMPIGILIEAGQADLLLASWLGADFVNRGERVYRLLGCELEFGGELPQPGETLRYEIFLDGSAEMNGTRLFFFHYDCTVDGELRLRVRNGQFGFFTDDELRASGGVVWSQETLDEARTRSPHARRFDAGALGAFARGDLFACFGPGFERAASHTRTPRLPSVGAELLSAIELDPHGGPWGRGYVRAEQHISPEDWFFKGHFKNDECMPGTLMVDVAAHLLAFSMTASGSTLERDGWRFAPVAGERVTAQCRGQVLRSARHVVYELFVREIGDGPIPTARADVLGSVDGLRAFAARDLRLQLVPDWPLPHRAEGAAGSGCDEHAVLACALGDPAEAFPAFADRIPAWRRLPRLPAPPFHLVTRVREVHEGRDGGALDAVAVTELDVREDAWYFREERTGTMPFSVLLEAALQPAGWLCAYTGLSISTDEDVALRNLDGDATVLATIPARTGTLVTRCRLTSFSRLGSTTLVTFAFECAFEGEPIVTGTTSFGIFPLAALADQIGLPTSAEERTRHDAPSDVRLELRAEQTFGDRLPHERLLMADRITGWWPSGGAAGLGLVRGELAVDPRAWLFKAHFFNDPVQPGSLGIQGLITLLQSALLLAGLDRELLGAEFEPLACGEPIVWKYRGQVVPTNGVVTMLVEITELRREERGVVALARGTLFVDAKKIYDVFPFGMRLAQPAMLEAAALPPPLVEEQRIELAREPWLRDHAITYVVPVLALTDLADRMAGVATKVLPHRTLVGLADVAVLGWTTLDDGVAELRVEARPESEDRVTVTLAVRDASGRYATAATAQALFADTYAAAPDPLAPLDAPPIYDAASAGAGTPYLNGFVTHGPAFRNVREARADARGASAVVDAGPDPLGVRTLNPLLLDGLLQSVPYTEHPGSAEADAEEVAGAPTRIVDLRLYGPPPVTGSVRAELRVGPAQPGRFGPVAVQGIAPDGRVWCEMTLLVAALRIGRLKRVPKAIRADVAFGRLAIPRLLTDAVAEPDGTLSTSVSAVEVARHDVVPGTVARIYDAPKGEARRLAVHVAVKEHLAARLGVPFRAVDWTENEPRASCALEPYAAYPIEVEPTQLGWRVRDAGPAQASFAPLRSFVETHAGSMANPVAHQLAALARAFVRELRFTDLGTRRIVGERPVLFLANHQVIAESALFAFMMAPLVAGPLSVMMRRSLATHWVHRLGELAVEYPGCTASSVRLLVDRSDPAAILAALEPYRRAHHDHAASLLVHVDGRYGNSCLTPVERVSSIFLDLALELGAPIVPVRFAGGLPVEPVGRPLLFPVDYGTQAFVVGRAIEPAELAGRTLAERVAVVRAALNDLVVDEGPSAPRPELAHAIEARIRRGRPLLAAVTEAVMERHEALDGFDLEPLRAILDGKLDASSEYRAWLEEYRSLLLLQ